MAFPYKITYDKDVDLVFVEKENGEKVELTNKVEILGIEGTKTFISEYLPPVPFAVVIPDNEELERERRSLYITSMLTAIIKGTNISKNFDILKANYDYARAKTSNAEIKYQSFDEILQAYRNLNSLVINAIIAAANYKVADVQKKSSDDFDAMLSSEERIAINDLRLRKKSIILKYAEEVANKSLDQWQRMKLLSERDEAIESLTKKDAYIGKLFKIVSLTSEAIDIFTSDEIEDIAYNAAMEFMNFKVGEDVTGVEKTTFKVKMRKYKSRLNRMYVANLKREEYAKLKEDAFHIVRSKR
jgi:hypothetical protein